MLRKITDWGVTWSTGAILAIVVFLAFNEVKNFVFSMTPIENIFVADLVVPMHRVGEDPLVQYRRDIKREFSGEFIVEIKNLENGSTACTGYGKSLYSPEEKLPSETTLSWYTNNDCAKALKAGQYFIETNYDINVDNYYTRRYKTVSNSFVVLPSIE